MSFLTALLKKFQRDNALFLARGLAFDIIICLIPGFFLVFIFFGFLFDSPRETVKFLMPFMKPLIPFSGQKILLNLFSVVKAKKVLGLMGMIGLLWTLSRVFGSIRTVLDAVFQVKEGRGIIEGKLFDFRIMLLSSVFFLGTVVITGIFTLLKKGAHLLKIRFLYLGLGGEMIHVFLAFCFTLGMFFCLYKFVPYRRIQTRTAVFAAVGAGVLWEFAKQVFSFFLFRVADITQIYGSFALLFVLALWVYYSCIIFILGAEIGWILERKR
jgi:membrane protein